MQSSEKEIMGIKEMILSLKRSVEKLAKDVNNSLRQKKEPSTNDGSRLKMKGKADETELTSCLGGESVDKSKYKKLEVPIFQGWIRSHSFIESRITLKSMI